MDILIATLWTALALFILYETSAVFSYLSLPILRPLNFLTKMKQFKEVYKKSVAIEYSDYMQAYHSNFLVKLFACRYCFGAWISLASALVIEKPVWLPAVYFGSHLLCSGFKRINDWMVNHE